MKKNKIVRLIVLIVLLCPGSLWARLVSDQEAEKAARQWAGLEQTRINQRLTQTPFSFYSISPLTYQEEKIGYLVRLQPRGFILIPSLTELSPISFISYDGDFDQVKDHPFLRVVQERLLMTRDRLGYSQENALLSGQPNVEKPEAAQIEKNGASWDLLLNKALLKDTLGSGEMPPLLTSKWSQWAPYNLFVPATTIPTGCVATATAQLMYYWKHPTTGRGKQCYDSAYGELCADFQNTAYDWANMLESYSGGETTSQRQAVARLMSDVGIAVGTHYAPTGSEAYLNANTLSAFFRYSSAATQVNRSSYASSVDWFNVLKTQMDNRLPVLLTIHNIPVNGLIANHAVVVDGYRTDNLINLLHVNMGWDGLSDGYCAVDQIYGEALPQADSAVINIYPETFVPDTSLSGTVTGYDGLPIEHVEVQIWKETTPANFQKISAAKTDGNGFYAVAVAPGKNKVYFYSEIANWYLGQKGSPRRFASEWFDNHGSMNWDMMIDEAEVTTLDQGGKKIINGVLEKQCDISVLGNPRWMTAIPYGEGDYSIQWGIDSYAGRYLLQRATKADYSDAVPIYHALSPPYPFEKKLPMGSYYYRVRKENQCGASLWTNTTIDVPYWIQNWKLYLPLIIN